MIGVIYKILFFNHVHIYHIMKKNEDIVKIKIELQRRNKILNFKCLEFFPFTFILFLTLIEMRPLSPFAPLYLSLTPPFFFWQSLHGCLYYGLYTYVLWLIPSPSCLQSCPLPSDSCQSVPCVHVSVSVLFVSSFCSLDSIYKWNHTVFVFLWLDKKTFFIIEVFNLLTSLNKSLQNARHVLGTEFLPGLNLHTSYKNRNKNQISQIFIVVSLRYTLKKVD